MGRGILERDVLVDSPKVLPVIDILSASYGHPRNSTKTFDICTTLRAMIDKQVRPLETCRTWNGSKKKTTTFLPQEWSRLLITRMTRGEVYPVLAAHGMFTKRLESGR